MSNIKKVDKCANPASTSSQIRPTRKRQRGVLIERNDSDNDSDFIDEKEDVYKNSKQNRTATTSSKTTKSVKKTSKGRIDAVSPDAIMAGQSLSKISSESFCGKI